jgi:hypothetical protein
MFTDAYARQRLVEYLLGIAEENGLLAGEQVFLRRVLPNSQFIELEHPIIQEPVRALIIRWGRNNEYAFTGTLRYDVVTQRVLDDESSEDELQSAATKGLIEVLSDFVGTDSKWIPVQLAVA